MSVLNTLQYKQCLRILTLPKYNAFRTDGTDLCNLETRRKKIANGCKGSFCQCKNKKYLQI